MYPVPLALDHFAILDHARGPLDVYPVPLRALLYQVLLNEVPPCLPLQSLHIRHLYAVPAGVSDQIVLVDLDATREIKVAE